ncbi:hypothetical protein SAMN05519103_01914 [Rhizobiales bacterium GAS113]|nr:hypothetical protein SAMN05519103_01914 [Rhizobiales bacterium GAS113]
MVILAMTATGLVAFSGIIFVFLTSLLKIEGHFAGDIACLPFIAAHYISDTVEQSLTKRDLGNGAAEISFDKFLISWKRMFIYAVITMLGWQYFPITLVAVSKSVIMGHNWEISPDLLPLLGDLASCIGAFLVGRWIGSRCASYGLIVLPLCIWVAMLIPRIIDWFVTPFIRGEPIAMIPTHASLDILVSMLYFAITALFFGLIGYWLGKNQREGRYFYYLLSMVPSSSRKALLDMAHDEANIVGARKAAAAMTA